MTGHLVRRLGWWYLVLVTVNVVGGQRRQKHVVKSPLCITEVNPLKNVCYSYEPTPTDQPTALRACKDKGGTLAALDTAETADFVYAGISGSFTGSHMWMGYNSDYGQWYDGSAFNWTMWCYNEPNNVLEKCLLFLKQDNCWNDGRCDQKFPSVCQLPGLATQAHARVEPETQVGVPSAPRSERSAESKIRCAQYCLQDPLCGKFNYNPTSGQCALYAEGAMVNEADGSQTFNF